MNHLYSVRVNDRRFLYQHDGPACLSTVVEIQKLIYERLYGRAPKEVGDNPPLWGIAVSPLGVRDLVEISVEVTKEVNVEVGLAAVK